MATVYTMDGETITEGLQGSDVCDEALHVARQCAERRAEPVILHDDDGRWTVSPDGSASRLPVWLVEGRGEDGRWSREYVEAGGSAEFDSEAEARRAVGDLVRVCGFDPDELRVRQL